MRFGIFQLFLMVLLVNHAAIVTHAAQPPATADAPICGARVLVLRFDPLSAGDRRDWIGKALQQTLLTEFGRVPPFEPITLPAEKEDGRAIADAATAIDLAKAAGAHLAILGSYQVVDTDLRITGQIVDVDNGRIVGMVRSTGTVRDLFGMEDAIAAQVRRQMPQLLGAPTTAPGLMPTSYPSGFLKAPNGPSAMELAVIPGDALKLDWHNSVPEMNPAARNAFARHAYLSPNAYWGYCFAGGCGWGYSGWGLSSGWGWAGAGGNGYSTGWLGNPR